MLLTTSLTPRFKHLASDAANRKEINCKKKNRRIVRNQQQAQTEPGKEKDSGPRRTSLRVRLQSFLPASGFAMGASATGVFFFSDSVSLPISLLSGYFLLLAAAARDAGSRASPQAGTAARVFCGSSKLGGFKAEGL